MSMNILQLEAEIRPLSSDFFVRKKKNFNNSVQ
jgi:hypothetical protein